MKFNKILVWLFIAVTSVSLLSILTPLTFTSVIIRNGVYILTILLSLVVGLRMKTGNLKYAITCLPLFCFLVLFGLSSVNSLADRRTDKWRTSWISHRKENSKIYIAGQVLDIGGRGYARRTVKIVPLTPVFDWINKIDTTTLDKSWIKTFEVYNPYHLK